MDQPANPEIRTTPRRIRATAAADRRIAAAGAPDLPAQDAPIYAPDGLDEGIAALAAEPVFAAILDRAGPPRFRRRRNGFATLLHIILEQQVSIDAAAAMHRRLSGLCRPLVPEGFLALDDAALRACGFSRQKMGYGRHLAEKVCGGEFDFDRLAAADDEMARALLIALKGIGGWSADIYLIFALGRADIWPAGDLGLQIAAGARLGLASRPAEPELRRLGEAWRPWRSVAACLLWQSYLHERGGSRRCWRPSSTPDHARRADADDPGLVRLLRLVRCGRRPLSRRGERARCVPCRGRHRDRFRRRKGRVDGPARRCRTGRGRAGDRDHPGPAAREELAHQGVSELLVVGSMHERKQLMAERADAFAVLPGGIGTLDELFDSLSWKQLGLHAKPIFLVDIDGYWASLRALLDHIVERGFATQQTGALMQVVPSVAALMAAVGDTAGPAGGLASELF